MKFTNKVICSFSVSEERAPTEAEIAKMKDIERKQGLPITRLVFSGGGAKGIVYPGAYRAMLETGLLEGVNEISGASAGAITAAFIAVGLPILSLREKSLTINMMDLMGARHLRQRRKGALRLISRDGKAMQEFIQRSILGSVREFFSEDAFENALIEPDVREQIMSIKNKIKGDNQTFTFGDLALLHRYFPKCFKNLTVNVVKYPGGEIQLCNSTHTPDLDIALACRASASIPMVLDPVPLTIDGVESFYLDGGIGDNLPTDYFPPGADPAQTMVFAFGEGLRADKYFGTDRVEHAMHYEHWSETIAADDIKWIIGDAIRLSIAHSLETKSTSFKNLLHEAVDLILDRRVCANDQLHISHDIVVRLKNILHLVIFRALKQKGPAYFSSLQQGNMVADRLTNDLAEKANKKINSQIYHPHLLERVGQNVLPKLIGFNPSYVSTERKKDDFLKIHKTYPMRTVDLHVGPISTVSFGKATKLARVMDAIGYADTMSFMLNHNIAHGLEGYCSDVIDSYIAIHRAILLGAGKTPLEDVFLQTIIRDVKIIEQSTDKVAAEMNVFQTIKNHVLRHATSPSAFAFTHAMEYKSGLLSWDNLAEQTYVESFRRSGYFSRSMVTGERFYRTSSLETKLAKMSSLDKIGIFARVQSDRNLKATRMSLTSNALQSIKGIQPLVPAANNLEDEQPSMQPLPFPLGHGPNLRWLRYVKSFETEPHISAVISNPSPLASFPRKGLSNLTSVHHIDDLDGTALNYL